MHPSQILRAGGAPDPKNGHFLGGWGQFGSPVQKGIISYSLSSNRQRPLAGTAHAAVFNVWRRFRAQALFWIPSMFAAYYAMEWATERNHFLNSKHGRVTEEE